ncbi:hypothetical protein ABMY20_12590 [Tenacibaculum sp. SSH1-16]|uniref:hypothetical protein n=1 Tax=Tenacibaculum sp. SSH1-16 TaxID=3136667 RepID=UPI0032C4B28A
MNTQDVVTQKHTQQSTAGGTVYFPFENGKIVTGVYFSEPTGYVVKVVEGYKTLAESQDDAETVSLGMKKTFCLVVETTRAVAVDVYSR